MPVGQPTRTTPMYSASIVTSDPTTGRVEAVIAGNLENVSVITTSVAFRWPVAGETWRIKNINNVWYLDEPYPRYNLGSTDATSTTAATTISTVTPGDTVINSPTGVVRILGSKDGSTDFTLTAKNQTSLNPVGVVLPFAGAVAPTGYLFCDGSSISRTTYAALFAVIGTTYGIGDGTTTFTLPDTRGLTIIGAGAGPGLAVHPLADKGGEERHTLTSAESGMPNHGHGLTDAGHGHGITDLGHSHSAQSGTNAYTAGIAGGYFFTNNPGTHPHYGGLIDNNITSITVNNNFTGITVNNNIGASASSSHNNMQPYLALNHIIKT